MLLDLGVGGAGLLRHVVHGGDEIGHAVHQRALDLVHVLVRAAQHLLQEDVGLAQALEQRGGVGAQHAVRLEHLGDRGGGGLLRLLDGGVGLLVQVAQRLGDRGRRALGGGVGAVLQLLERAGDRGWWSSSVAIWVAELPPSSTG